MANISQRMLRAAKLDAQLYEEVEADKSSMQQAMIVVVMSSIAAGLATYERGGNSWNLNGNHRCLDWLVCLGLPDLYHWNKTFPGTTNQG